MDIKKMLKNQKGFSLIELMIVVAIIGLLAAIGIPQYAKFQAKARTSEAKAHLAAIFNGEISFRSEWNTFSTDLADLGVGAVGNGLRYTAGFNNAATCGGTWPAGAPTEDTANNVQLHRSTVSSSADASWAAGTGISSGGALVTLNGTPACTTNASFLAAATGDPRNTAAAVGATSDTWTINQSKLVSNPVPGL